MALSRQAWDVVRKSGQATADSRLHHVQLFDSKSGKYSFATFLVMSRFRPMQRMQSLQLLGLDKEFMVGFEKIDIYEPNYNDEPDELVKCIESFLIEKEFSGYELFDSIVESLGILQVNAKDSIEPALHSSLKGELNSRYSSTQGMVIFCKNPLVIITDDGVYTFDETAAEKIRETLKIHVKDFEGLLKIELTEVAHAIYLDWLMKWFPGLIRVRSLESTNSID